MAAPSRQRPQGTVDSVLDEAPTSLFHLKTAVTSGMGFFTDSYDLNVISTALRNARLLGFRELSADDVRTDGGFRTVGLDVAVDDELDMIEFRLFSRGGTTLAVDYVDLVPLEEGPHAP